MIRLIAITGMCAAVAAALCLMPACSGSPEATAKWYLSDKPAAERVPVSDTTDPGDSAVPDGMDD